MAGEKREVVLDLLARDKSGPAIKKFGKGLDDVGDSADKASKKTRGLGDSTEDAGRKAGSFGSQADSAAHGVARLDTQIASATKQLEGLALQFANAGDKATRLDLSKNIRTLENDIKRNTKNKGILQSLIPDPSPSDIAAISSKLSSAVGSAMSGVMSNPAALIGGSVLAAAFAPTIGAAAAGAVVGGVGLGGIIGGVALAAKDRSVASYATDIGDTFTKSLNASAKTSFLKPVQDALVQVDALAQRTAPKIGKIFEDTAPSLQGFTKHVIAAGDALVDGLGSAASRSGPAIEAIGRLIEDTSVSIGGLFEVMGKHSEQGASAIDDLSGSLQHLIEFGTGVIDFLGNMKATFDGVDEGIDSNRYALEDMISWLDITADGYEKGSTAAKLYRDGVIGVAGSTNDYAHYATGAIEKTNAEAEAHTNAAKAAEGQRTALDELSKELKGQADPVFGLMNAMDKLSTAKDKATTASRKFGAQSRESRAATRELALASIDLQGKVGALGDTFDGKLTPEMIANLRTSGATEAQIRDLAEQFRAAKVDGENFAKNYKANVGANGTGTTRNALNGVKTAANAIPRAINIAVSATTFASVGRAAAAAAQILAARAAGGPVSKNTPYWVGESGPELVIPETNGRVLSASASRAATTRMGGGTTATGGVAPGVLRLELAGQQEMVTMMRYLIRSANLLQGV